MDDSEVETPGSCHLETWVSRRASSSGDAVANPACTPVSLPNLEIGAGTSYDWSHGSSAVTLGPAVKWNIRPLNNGLGIALDASATWNSTSDRVSSASLVIPASLPISAKVLVNLNAGIQWARSDSNLAGFFGGQIIWQESTDLGVMTEVYERTIGGPGTQSGIRWNPDSKTDVDILLSHAFVGPEQEAATVGVTRRF